MKFQEFKNMIEKTYAKSFPNSRCSVYLYKGFGRAVEIVPFMALDESEVASGIMGNDMMKIHFTINLPDSFDPAADDLPENLTMENLQKFYAIKPENSYLYCDYRNLSYRKTSGNPEKILKTFGKFVAKLHDSIVADYLAGNIHKNHEALVAEKMNLEKYIPLREMA